MVLHYYEVDVTDSHLSEDELAELVLRSKEEQAQEARKERERKTNMRRFNFVGGLC